MHIDNIKGSEKVCKKRNLSVSVSQTYLTPSTGVCVCVCANLILFSFSPFKSWGFLTVCPGYEKFPSNFSGLRSWYTSETGPRFIKKISVLKRRNNLQMHDCCGLHSKILHTSGPKNQIYSWSIGCFWVFASCGLCIQGKLMEMSLITGWLVVEFLDCKE